MAVPTRPLSGAVVESAWGQATHDAAVGVAGVQGTAPTLTVSSTRGIFAPVATRGRSSMIVGTSVVVPFDGLWQVSALFSANPAASQIWRCFIESDQSGSFQSVAFGAVQCAASGWGQAQSMSAVLFMSAGKAFRFAADSNTSLGVNIGLWSVACRGADWQ